MANLFNQATGFDPKDVALESAVSGDIDPRLQHLVADEEVEPHEEQIMGEALIDMNEWLYSDKGLAAVVQALKAGGREPFESIPDVVVPMLQKVQTTNPDADAVTFFAEGGLIQEAVDRVIEIAEAEGIPGIEDEEQKQAAIINLYRMVGEHIIRTQDKEAIGEAKGLANTMARTTDDGSLAPPESFAQKNDMLRDEVKQGLGLL